MGILKDPQIGYYISKLLERNHSLTGRNITSAEKIISFFFYQPEDRKIRILTRKEF